MLRCCCRGRITRVIYATARKNTTEPTGITERESNLKISLCVPCGLCGLQCPIREDAFRPPPTRIKGPYFYAPTPCRLPSAKDSISLL